MRLTTSQKEGKGSKIRIEQKGDVYKSVKSSVGCGQGLWLGKMGNEWWEERRYITKLGVIN